MQSLILVFVFVLIFGHLQPSGPHLFLISPPLAAQLVQKHKEVFLFLFALLPLFLPLSDLRFQ